MSVWYCLPSKRPVAQVAPVIDKWRERGYAIALFLDECDRASKLDLADYVTFAPQYPGYAVAMNTLMAAVLEMKNIAEWFVCGADDVEPDYHWRAQRIATDCSEYFDGTFGVMQPTGDRWGDAQGAYIDRIAGSPWIGREFARRMYGGAGPYWHEYTHMGVDEELQAVAMKLGVFWQRPDLTHYHAHWGRPRPGERMAQGDRMPAFLAEANSPREWARYKRIFAERQAAGFPGHEPL